MTRFAGSRHLLYGMAAAVLGTFTSFAVAAETFSCPNEGGDMVFGQEAQVSGLDMHFSSAISTRNIAMHIYESLMTRAEDNSPIHELAASHEVSDDGLTYTFKLRDGITFHNGKEMTSADVLASYERYQKIGIDRTSLEPVESMSAPDPSTFVIKLKQKVPVFIEQISSFRVPIVILPAEEAAKEANQIEFIGTGPFEFVEWVPDGFVKLARFDDYAPNAAFEGKTGFGGYKVACFDTVTFRIVKEPGARVAGLETGELQGVEDVPTKAAERLADNPDIKLIPVDNWWIHIAVFNQASPPTDKLGVRKAIQVGLDMEEIMEIATDGAYTLNHGLQYPGNPYFVEGGKEWYNVNDKERAKQYLEEAGYNGEPVVLLTNSDYTNMYNAALVMSEQLKDIGINAELKVVDWPTSRQERDNTDNWNLFFTGFGTGPSIGPQGAVVDLVPPANLSRAPENPELNDAWSRMQLEETFEGRKAAFNDVQTIFYENAYAIVMGDIQKVQGVRSNVDGFVPFRIPRLWNVWFEG
ncbi:MAG TPA: ABC transporter substrate-binding protein [Geminicoccaceae bacterium]|nr:ABC transporter substrate-binding protein [Geminicoccaceae bacterium]